MRVDCLNQVQKASFRLMQKDFSLLFTVIKNNERLSSNYISMMMPYFGLIVDGAEEWIKRVNKVNKTDLGVPLFDNEENAFYGTVRQSIKIWDYDYESSYRLLENSYKTSYNYFKQYSLSLGTDNKFDIFGVDFCNRVICGNTLLCFYYYNYNIFDEDYNNFLKSVAEIAGKYTLLFEAKNEYLVNDKFCFGFIDCGGKIESPVGNIFSYKYVLFSILCQINFLVWCVDRWIIDDVSSKLRFAYLLYYYLVDQIKQIDQKEGLNFTINPKYKSDDFRNAMAHYGLGVVLNEDELIENDIMFGLTNKVFGEDYSTIKSFVYGELSDLAKQIGVYLKLPKGTY